MKRITSAMVILAAMFAWGCVKEEGGRKVQDQYTFDFATTSLCDLSIDYRLVGHSKGSLIEVYAENPYVSQDKRELKAGIEPLLRTFVTKAGKFSGKVRVPNYVKSVFVKTNTLGAAGILQLDVNNGRIAFDAATPPAVSDTRAAGDYGYPSGMYVLKTRNGGGGDWTRDGRPNYLASNNVPRTGLLDEIKTVLKEGVRLPGAHPELMDGGNKVINVYEECDLEMVFLHENCSYLNTLGYYTYPTPTEDGTVTEPTSLAAINHPTIVFPNASLSGEGGALLSGNTVKLKYWDGSKFVDKFPKGTTVAFFVVSNGFKSSSYAVGAGNGTFYSNFNLVDNQKQQMVAFRDSKNEISIIGVEDTDRNKLDRGQKVSDEDFNDVVFYVKSNPAGATDVPGNDPDPDPDPEDDPEEATTSYKGTLIFEDLWPNQGDYDLNDVVVEYTCEVTTMLVNDVNRVIRIVDKFRPVNCGAELQNGFAVQYGFAPSLPTGMTIETNYPGGAHKYDGTDAQYRYTPINWGGDKTAYETDQDKATILLFEDIRQAEIASGEWVWTVTTLFNAYRPLVAEVGYPPYNPFIISMRGPAGDLRGREVHLTNYKPTAKGTYELFGTKNDLSQPPLTYYISDDNYPFAINLPVHGFGLPVEKQRIETLYPLYDGWAKSKGEINQEWYR